MLKFLLDLLEQLKDLPGFRFLRPYYYSIQGKIYNMQDQAGDMEDEVSQFKKGLSTLKNVPKDYKNSKGSKKR